MFDWFRHLFSVNGHSDHERVVSSAHEALRSAAEKHIEADREAEIVLRVTVTHTNNLIKTAKSAVDAVRRGENNDK